jgi:hypothetical protein
MDAGNARPEHQSPDCTDLFTALRPQGCRKAVARYYVGVEILGLALQDTIIWTGVLKLCGEPFDF